MSVLSLPRDRFYSAGRIKTPHTWRLALPPINGDIGLSTISFSEQAVARPILDTVLRLANPHLLGSSQAKLAGDPL